MNSKLLLDDTDVLINVVCTITEAVALLERLENYDQLLCSVITGMGLVVGCRNKTE